MIDATSSPGRAPGRRSAPEARRGCLRRSRPRACRWQAVRGHPRNRSPVTGRCGRTSRPRALAARKPTITRPDGSTTSWKAPAAIAITSNVSVAPKSRGLGCPLRNRRSVLPPAADRCEDGRPTHLDAPCCRRRTFRRRRHDRRGRHVLRRRSSSRRRSRCSQAIPTVACLCACDGGGRLPRHRLLSLGRPTTLGRLVLGEKRHTDRKTAPRQCGRAALIAHPGGMSALARTAGTPSPPRWPTRFSSPPSPVRRRRAGREAPHRAQGGCVRPPVRGDVVDRRLRLRRDDPGYLVIGSAWRRSSEVRPARFGTCDLCLRRAALYP